MIHTGGEANPNATNTRKVSKSHRCTLHRLLSTNISLYLFVFFVFHSSPWYVLIPPYLYFKLANISGAPPPGFLVVVDYPRKTLDPSRLTPES